MCMDSGCTLSPQIRTANDSARTRRGTKTLQLEGVAETMLLTLWWRVEAAKRNLTSFQDPCAIKALDSIDGDFAEKFGKVSFGPLIRAEWSDLIIRAFLAKYPHALILALGDGLETQFWRVDNGFLKWYSVDLPEAISVRRQLLPRHERNYLIEGSVTNPHWLESIDSDRPTLIIANGLLMYLERCVVVQLLHTLAVKFGYAEFLFDTVPDWVSRRAAKGINLTRLYRLPAMPFGVSIYGLRAFSQEVPTLRIKSARTYGELLPSLTSAASILSRWSYFRNHLSPALIHAELDYLPESNGSVVKPQ